MRIALTTAGIAALQSSPSSLVLGSYRLGTGKAYVPDQSDTDLHGSVVTSGVPQAPQVINANVVRYSVFLDLDAGPYTFGEMGLYLQNGDLFSLSCGDSDIIKLNGISTMVIDVYVTSVDGTFVAWIDVGESSDLRLASIPSVDLLPPSRNANPNVYAVTGLTSIQSTFLAYTDRQGLWMFDAYKFSTTYGSHVPILSGTSQSITIDASHYDENWDNTYYGSLIIQFASGQLYSICRYVDQVTVGPTEMVLTFSTPLLIVPQAGDLIMRFKREPLSLSSLTLNPATTTSLGGVIVGSGLDVQPDGLLSVNLDSVDGGAVRSVNGQQGDVELDASDIPGSVLTINNQHPDGDGNINIGSYTLPVASPTTLGGVRVPGPSLVVDGAGNLHLGFTPVTSVNSRSDDVVIEGLIDPVELEENDDLDTITNPGLYYAPTDQIAESLVNAPPNIKAGSLEVIRFASGSFIQRWSQASGSVYERSIQGGSTSVWVTIGGAASIPLASDVEPGLVMVGSGLDIDPSGTLSATFKTVNGQGPDAVGNVNITAASIGAVPSSQVGVPGGAAGYLDAWIDDPDDPTPEPGPDEMLYRFGRLPEGQLPLGALVYYGEWDADANSAETADYLIELQDGGLFQLVDATDPGTAVPFVAPANGKLFRVSVAGSTSLDGLSDWQLGDLVVAIGDRWYKINNPVPTTMTEIEVTVGSTEPLTVPPGIDPIGCQLIVRVKDEVTDDWYDISPDVASIVYSTTGVELTNEHSADLTFRYRFVR